MPELVARLCTPDAVPLDALVLQGAPEGPLWLATATRPPADGLALALRYGALYSRQPVRRVQARDQEDWVAVEVAWARPAHTHRRMPRGLIQALRDHIRLAAAHPEAHLRCNGQARGVLDSLSATRASLRMPAEHVPPEGRVVPMALTLPGEAEVRTPVRVVGHHPAGGDVRVVVAFEGAAAARDRLADRIDATLLRARNRRTA